MCYANMGNFYEADKDAQLSIDLNSSYTKAYFRKTAALIGLNKYTDAKSTVLLGLEQMPNDKDLQAQLTKIDNELKKIQATTNNSNTPPTTATTTTASTTTATTSSSVASSPVKPPAPKPTDKMAVVEEDDDVDIVSAGVVRGYKKLADGRVTTFFNNTLDEQVCVYCILYYILYAIQQVCIHSVNEHVMHVYICFCILHIYYSVYASYVTHLHIPYTLYID